ncbi:helix-turn-helix transcriptional regulator [Cellulosilyticum sp. I15G10I2]|uniref:helix-turn-helix transcriptional regulator n=1 Tax=Cellulosilyticum sp. I15G10I2 TaxID=1892843 RepID=UPI00085C2903|nr:YafY family protein [Cellulosilyticum sp. I15G10I2]
MKIDRLIAIITILLQRERITAPELAQKLEVSRRTIGRDIDDLCKAGIPIITWQGGGGGISIAEGYNLDRSVLTREELQNILIGLRSLSSAYHTSGLENLLKKLSPNQEEVIALKDSMVIDLASHYKESLSAKINLLQGAIKENHRISFDYYSPKGVEGRLVEPYFIVFKWSAWYVFGFCMKSEDFRLFKLNRLWELALSLEVFKPREVPVEKQDLDRHLTDNHKMIVLFDKSEEYLLIEEYGPDCYKQTEDGKLRFERGYTNRDYIIRWLLGFGDRAQVIFPKDLKDEIKEQVRKMLKKYK